MRWKLPGRGRIETVAMKALQRLIVLGMNPVAPCVSAVEIASASVPTKEQAVALIDLHAMSKVFYKSLGANLDKAFQDGTHHNNYGSYELARCVVEGMKQNKLGLVKFLAEDAGSFDPAHPDPFEQFDVPPSPNGSSLKPDGN